MAFPPLASFECRAYARSLMHLEEHLRDNEKDFEQCMTKLQQVYGALDEPDYVNGLAKIRPKKPTLEELIHQHQVTGILKKHALKKYDQFTLNTT